MTDSEERDCSRAIRRGILVVFVVGSLGLCGELLLLGHFEEWRQQVPLALLALALALLATRVFHPTASSLHLFRLIMLAFVLGGAVGFWFHLQANMEFEVEMYPTLVGWELLYESLSGAMPTLAPGALIQLGLIGWLYTCKHPALHRKTKEH